VAAALWKIAARREYALALLISLILIAVSIRNPDFATPGSAVDILVRCAQPAIVACGVMLVIVTGEIDISVGSSMGFLTAVVGILMSQQHFPVWAGWVLNGFREVDPAALEAGRAYHPFSVPAAIVITLCLGTLIGVINGLLVTLVRIPSIIVTLGMLTILKGFTILLMKPGNITDVPESFHAIGIGDLGRSIGLPFPLGRTSLWIAAAVILATWALIKHTPIGRRIFAVGSNAHAAALAGVSEVKTKLFAFALTGLLVGVATVVTEVAVFDNGAGEGFELLVVTCVVVGGVSISGGSGSLLGVMLGVVLLLMQKKVLIFLKLAANASNWDRAIQGALILGAVLVDHFASRRAKKGGGH
jgi:ribose/xylose/arabinose/galactoside ABC-type transport system permease subunit